MAVGSFFLCSPNCPKQPRTSYPFYEFFYTTISFRISGPNKWNRSNLFNENATSKQLWKYEPIVSNQLVGTPFFCQVATKISAACFLWLDSIHPSNSSLHSLDMTTDYGRSMKPFFIKISNFWAWADNLGRYNLGYFRPIYQHPFWYCESLVHVFY